MTYWTWWLFKMIGQKLHTTGAPNQPKMNKSILAKIYTVLFSHLSNVLSGSQITMGEQAQGFDRS